MSNDWNRRLKDTVPKQDIPTFLVDLQALVAALREDRPWEQLLTTCLREHAQLALDYMQDGAKKDAVRQALS